MTGSSSQARLKGRDFDPQSRRGERAATASLRSRRFDVDAVGQNTGKMASSRHVGRERQAARSERKRAPARTSGSAQ
jgi:hypothetical protein